MAKNEALRQARLERGWSQRRLADELQVGEPTVRSWESGRRTPSLEYRNRLSDIFEKSPEQLGWPPLVILDAVAPSSQLASAREAPPPRDKNRQHMLSRVFSRWVSGVLELSLTHEPIVLELQDQPDAVVNPWEQVVQETNLPPRPLPAGTHITTVYDEADGELLILGEPGAGKTMLLLELARMLLERARRDEQQPMPVVFNLSEWVAKQAPLREWLVEELHAKYQVPSKLAQTWIRTEQILLLLDGLDEVAPDSRMACIHEINAYREIYGLVPMVVCSRTADYLSQPVRLLLNRAIAILPLTTHQVDEYIVRSGSDLAMLQLALQHDPELQEVASTPLMLNTLAIAYQGLPDNEILTIGLSQVQRNLVFERYVERMLERRVSQKLFTAEQVKHYLGWLAQQMQKWNQTEFYLERMQPTLLDSGHEQHHYRRTAIRLITITQCIVGGALAAWLKGGLKNGVVGSGNGILGLFGGGAGNSMLGWMSPGIGGGNQGGASLIIMLGIVFWLVMILVGSPSLPIITPQAIRHGLLKGIRTGLKAGALTCGLTIPFFSLLGGIQHGLTYGLGIGFFLAMPMGLLRGMVEGLRYEHHLSAEKEIFSDQLMDGLVLGVGGGLGFLIVELLLRVNYQSTLIYSAIATLFFSLAYGFGGGTSLFPSLGQTIKPAEIVTWSWKQIAQDMGSNASKSIVVALTTLLCVSIAIGGMSSIFFLDIGYGLHYGLVFGTISGLIVGIAGILTSTLKSGWSSETLPEDQHTVPNEGISRSGRNALLGACVFAPVGGIASGLACGIGFGLVGELSTWPVMAMAFALMLAMVFFLAFAIAHGGIAWLEHYTLRWYLWRAGHIPKNYVRFLNTASEYALLRKVGGGYMFTHRLVLEYFAHLSQSRHGGLSE